MRELLFIIATGAIIVALMGMSIISYIDSLTAPCSDFKNISLKDVPARCIKELTQ